ncbi:hypothetical protein RBU49_13260 [Clostridium sp. MB40-C1]|uniref:hypothetical protein n=1 Tax=Clostridium sp. MB40-C1 TaxID=3070996 RepID=UPI0027DFBDDD|nr:hypothetical protein [Clostridium sp. MB40-C1]WMJ79829.1 hypothetical protein RBU49_13260 [Clostridium sp. MB40-C1]
MQGKILDINDMDAFIVFENGITMDLCTSHLPPNSKIGDKININTPSSSTEIANDKMTNFFI